MLVRRLRRDAAVVAADADPVVGRAVVLDADPMVRLLLVVRVAAPAVEVARR